MPELFHYRDNELFCHHTLTGSPDSSSFAMHAHDKFELLYIISGSCTFTVEGSVYEVCKDDLFITRAAEAHHISVKADCPYERCAVHFSPDIAAFCGCSSLLAPFSARNAGILNRFTPEDFGCDMYIRCVRGICSAPSDRPRMTAYLLALLAEITRAYNTKCAGLTEQSGTASSKLVEYVNENLFGDISLESISKHFYMSVNNVNRRFRAATGTTAGEYIRIKRLLAARERIRAGDFALTAACACGFGDYSAFYRAYRQYFGCTPRADAPGNDIE